MLGVQLHYAINLLKYVVVSSHSIKAGTIPKLFAEAKTETEATEALESARIILFGDTKSKEKPRPISQTIETAASIFQSRRKKAHKNTTTAQRLFFFAVMRRLVNILFSQGSVIFLRFPFSLRI